jgi:two-component system NarL family response regulator
MMTPANVMISDDHPMVTEGIQSILESYDDIRVDGCFSNTRAAIDPFEALEPDVIMMT